MDRFIYYGCKTGCDDGRTYVRSDSEDRMVPVPCTHCLEMRAQQMHPEVSYRGFFEMTREVLYKIVHFKGD